MNKNILWLVSWYPNTLAPFDGDFIQRQAQAVARFQKLTVIYIKKDDNHVITKNEKIFTSIEDNLTEVAVYYHSPKTGIRLIDRLQSAFTYKKLYRKVLNEYINENGKPDMVHVHVAWKAGAQAVWLKDKFNIPFVVSEHWSGYFKNAKVNIYEGSFVVRNYIKKILSQALLLLPVTKNLGKTIHENLVEVNFEVIPNVVNTDIFYFRKNSPDKFRFIHISSLNYYKNPEGIIRAARDLALEGFEFELQIVGAIKQDLIDLAGILSANEYISFKGIIAYEDVAKEMQAASSLILFSRVESLPCVMLEALCCGLPVITSDVGGIPEVINESNGLLVTSENEVQLKNAMRKMIMNYDNYNRAAIADNAASKFSFATVGKQIVDLYRQISKSE